MKSGAKSQVRAGIPRFTAESDWTGLPPLKQLAPLEARVNVSPAWAWAAGLFEGEGSITIRKRRGRPTDAKEYGQASLQLATTDLDVLQRFVSAVGYGNIHIQEKRLGQTKRQYRWHVSRATEVVRILNTFMPYLGERRKARAIEAIDFLC